MEMSSDNKNEELTKPAENLLLNLHCSIYLNLYMISFKLLFFLEVFECLHFAQNSATEQIRQLKTNVCYGLNKQTICKLIKFVSLVTFDRTVNFVENN